MADNPFSFGSIVGEEHFCPRIRLSKRLVSLFKSKQNAVLIGPRRVGKSSLIHHAARQIPKGRLVYIDCWGVHTIEDFVRRCVQALESIEDKGNLVRKITQAIPGISVTVGIDPISGSPTLTPTLTDRKKKAPESIAQIARLWELLADGKEKIIVALDEFQDVSVMDDGEQVVGILRKEIQVLGAIPFCFCGSIRNEMWKIFCDERGAFYKSAATLEVSRDDFDDWTGFLMNRFESGGLKIDEPTLNEILTIADGNPGDTQQLCSAVWEQAKATRRRKVTSEIVNQALLQVFADERKGYEHIVAEISGQQLAVLRSIARLGGESVQSGEFLEDAGITHASSAKAAATRLEKQRILQSSPEGLRFSNPFFKAWLLHVGY